MRVATFNINNINKRLDNLKAWLSARREAESLLEFSQHFEAQLGHRDLLFCDPTYFNPSPTADPRTRGSVRRASGFVEIPITLTEKLAEPSDIPAWKVA